MKVNVYFIPALALITWLPGFVSEFAISKRLDTLEATLQQRQRYYSERAHDTIINLPVIRFTASMEGITSCREYTALKTKDTILTMKLDSLTNTVDAVLVREPIQIGGPPAGPISMKR